MASRCGCGSSSVCSCLIVGGDNVTVTGVGSNANPYIVSSGGGGAPPAPMTLAALAALQTGNALVVGQTYTATDWTLTNLPGPNRLSFTALATNDLGEFVLIDTPVTLELGPNRGIYSWTLGYMTYIEDGLNNRLHDLFGTLLSDFPFGNFTWTDNTISANSLNGAIAAATAGASFIGNEVSAGIVDMTNWAVGAITNCVINNGSGVTLGPDTNLFGVALENSILAIDPAAGAVLIEYTNFRQSGTYTIANPVGFYMGHSDVRGLSSSYDDTGATRGFGIDVCQIDSSPIDRTACTAGSSQDQMNDTQLSFASLTWTVTVDPASVQSIIRSGFRGQAVVTLVNPAGISPIESVTVDCQSTLHVQAGGAIKRSFVTANGTLNTGAFAHDAVVIEYQGVTTLTAANVNKRLDSLGSNII